MVETGRDCGLSTWPTRCGYSSCLDVGCTAVSYLEATVGDVGPASSRERKEAFVDGVADFVATAEKYGVELVRAA